MKNKCLEEPYFQSRPHSWPAKQFSRVLVTTGEQVAVESCMMRFQRLHGLTRSWAPSTVPCTCLQVIYN